jgi:hypothetical protein
VVLVRREEQIDALYEELEKVLYRFGEEFDLLERTDILWVLQLLQQQVVDVGLDFQSEFWDIDEDEDEDEDNK